VLSLDDESELLRSYGFEIGENNDTKVYLCKIKLNPDRKPYNSLAAENNSGNSIELFMES
jgi:hypothetical protein